MTEPEERPTVDDQIREQFEDGGYENTGREDIAGDETRSRRHMDQEPVPPEIGDGEYFETLVANDVDLDKIFPGDTSRTFSRDEEYLDSLLEGLHPETVPLIGEVNVSGNEETVRVSYEIPDGYLDFDIQTDIFDSREVRAEQVGSAVPKMNATTWEIEGNENLEVVFEYNKGTEKQGAVETANAISQLEEHLTYSGR